MNKTISANISGFVFNIEEHAYEKLYRYLQTIRGYFQNSDGCEEIMADIEARIAELFADRLDDKKNVISMTDVDEVIAVMGRPEQYLDEEDLEEETQSTNQQNSSAGPQATRRIYRNPDESVIAGVCSGISAHFGWDPLWIRIAFILLVLSGGFGLAVYLVLWILIPKAATTAEKLRMRGEDVNTENIARTVKERFNDFESELSNIDTSPQKEKVRRGADKVGEFLDGFFKIFGRIIGIVMIFAALGLLIAVVSFVTGADAWISIGQDELRSISWDQATALFFPSENIAELGFVSVLLLLGIPMIYFLVTGIRLAFKLKTRIKGLGLSMFLLFLAGVGLAFYVGSSTAREFTEYGQVDTRVPLVNVETDTLYLDILDDIYFSNHIRNHHNEGLELITNAGDSIAMGTPFLDIHRGHGDEFEVEIIRMSRGASQKEAIRRADGINYQWTRQDSLLKFAPYFTFSKDDHWRNQRVRINIYVPEGKAVYLSENSDRVIYDIDNVTSTRDEDMVSEIWTMMPDGLTCLNCQDGYSGPYRARFEDGEIRAEGKYHYGELDGRYVEYFRNGQLKTESNYLSGKLHGSVHTWYENGQLESESTWVNGLLHGTKTEWHITGDKLSEQEWQDGTMVTETLFDS